MDGIASFLAGTSDASHSAPRKMSQDPGDWAGDIIRLVSDLTPPELPIQPQVHFNQQDDINGHAMGSVHLADQNGDVKAFIPVIIKRFVMQPLDVLISDNRFAPFTETRLREVFASTAMDDGVIDLWKIREGTDESLNETNPSSGGMFPFAGAEMDREQFLKTLDPQDQEDMRQVLEKNAAALAVLKRHDKTAAVKELLAPVSGPEAAADVATVMTFEKVSAVPGASKKYRIMTSHEGTFGPQIVEVDEGGLRVKLKEAVPENRDEWLTRVHEGSATVKEREEGSEKNLAGAESITQGPKGSEVFLYRVNRTEPEQGEDQTACFAMTTSGQRIRGYLLPKVIDLDGTHLNTKLFIGRAVAGVQPRIAIERLDAEVDFGSEIDDAVPRHGDTGTLVHMDKDGDAVALIPMTIESVWTQGAPPDDCVGEAGMPRGASMTISAKTMHGKLVELVVGRARGIVDITPDYRLTGDRKARRRRYSVSSDFRWVPMPDFKEFMDNPRVMRDATDLTKTASAPLLRVIDTGLGYEFQADWVKTAQALLDKEAMSQGLKEALMAVGVGGLAASPLLLNTPPVPPDSMGGVVTPGGRHGAWAKNEISPIKVFNYRSRAADGRPGSSGGGDVKDYVQTRGIPKGSSIDLGCLSEAEARHMLCELGANTATATSILKAASERGSLRVRGLENPIEKLARHPFLAMPSRGRMQRAALMALGLGGAGLAAGAGVAAGADALAAQPPPGNRNKALLDAMQSTPADGYEYRPRSLYKDQDYFDRRRRERAMGYFNDAADDVMNIPGVSAGLSAGKNVVRGVGAGLGLDSRDLAREASLDSFLPSRMVKTQAAHPPTRALIELRALGRAAFPKLAYVASVETMRAAGDDDGGRAKLALASETLDRALELNFLNPQNLSYFIALRPKMVEVMDGLGRLLVAVRLGLPEVDEETVRTAFKQIDRIIGGLRALSFAETDE